MRLWSLHPQYLDPQGLVALWRESLLARAVLSGQTKGYRQHPQLHRFQSQNDPPALVNAYLAAIYSEALKRGYKFDATKLSALQAFAPLPVTSGQMALEWRHLQSKLATRSPTLHERWRATTEPEPHPLFQVVAGPVEAWERAAATPLVNPMFKPAGTL